MRATLGANLEVYGASARQRERIKTLATWRRKGRLPKGQPRELCLWGDFEDRVVVPRALLSAVRQVVPGLPQPRDDRRLLPPVAYPWAGPNLFGYQLTATRRILAQQGGTLLAPSGSGKTEMALALIAHIGQPALWLVHDLGLARQALARAKSVFPSLPDSAYGRIWEGERSIGSHITFAVTQTLVKYRYPLEDRFGTVVVDECHHAAAPTQAEVVCRFPAAWRIGATATTEREDGLEPAIYALFGSPVRVTVAELLAAGRYFMPELRPIFYRGLTVTPGATWNDMQQACVQDVRRNLGICRVVQAEVKAGRRVLVLVNWIAHAKLLSKILSEQARVPAAYVVGAVNPARREVLLRALQKWPGRALVATRLADEGLDLPALDCLFSAIPGKAIIRQKQRLGRLMRSDPNKRTAVYYDLVDASVPTLVSHWQRRLAVYREMGLVPTQQ